MTDFYKEEGGEPTVPMKVTLGDTEFTTQELEDLVGAGKKLKEIEEKQGQPVDDILRSWGRRGEVLGKYKKLTNTETPDELEANWKNPVVNPQPQVQLDDDALRTQVRAEAQKFGLLTKEEAQQLANEVYQNNRAGEKLVNKVNKLLKEAKIEEKPVTTVEKLLEFMADPANPKDPQNAYDIMFKKELKEWESKQISKIKPQGMMTTTAIPSTKEPEVRQPTTREGLKEVLREHFANYGK